MIEDWELGALFWRLVDQGRSPQQAADEVRHKFFDELCGPDKATYFFVGTILAHPATWVVIGVFYPKKITPAAPGDRAEPGLFDAADTVDHDF